MVNRAEFSRADLFLQALQLRRQVAGALRMKKVRCASWLGAVRRYVTAR
jgi:hypothetical protein